MKTVKKALFVTLCALSLGAMGGSFAYAGEQMGSSHGYDDHHKYGAHHENYPNHADDGHCECGKEAVEDLHDTYKETYDRDHGLPSNQPASSIPTNGTACGCSDGGTGVWVQNTTAGVTLTMQNQRQIKGQ